MHHACLSKKGWGLGRLYDLLKGDTSLYAGHMSQRFPTEITMAIFSNSEVIQTTGALDINLSDHLAVMVTRKKVMQKLPKIYFKERSYKNYNRERFQELLLAADWTEFYNLDNPNELWETMENIMLTNIDSMCPIKSFKVKRYREPWITNEAIEAIKDKDRLLASAKRTMAEDDWVSAKRVRNEVGRDLRNLRADFLRQQQEAHKNDPKTFWKTIAGIVPTKKNRGSEIWLRDELTDSNIRKENTAEIFNSFFHKYRP